MTTEISTYQALKIELETVENELKNHKNISNELYTHLKKKQEILKEKIDECPLIYEIWLSGYSGSMTMYDDPDSIKERYIDKEKAYARLDELNNGCNYGEPYYMKIVELDG